jgi:hypothetical protein
MEPARPSAPDLTVSEKDCQQHRAEPSDIQVTLLAALPYTPECPLLSAFAPDTRSAKRHCGQATETTTPVAKVARIRRQTSSSKKKEMLAKAQLAERRRVSESAAAAAAASQDNNDKLAEVEANEGDLTDVETDFEETAAVAMRKDRVV